jgi:shikimate kinase
VNKPGLFRAVALVGPRGAGKTTLAPLLAAALGWTAADTDQILGERVGDSAGRFLLRAGLAEFRRVEEAVAAATLPAARRAVVALGGGAVLTASVRRELQAPDVLTVFLRADVAVLAARLRESPEVRPPLTGLTPEQEVEHLLAERLSHYLAVADLQFDTGAAAPAAVVAAICAVMAGRAA